MCALSCTKFDGSLFAFESSDVNFPLISVEEKTFQVFLVLPDFLSTSPSIRCSLHYLTGSAVKKFLRLLIEIKPSKY